MSNANPYAAPDESQEVTTDAPGTIAGMELASQNRRLVNFIVDYIMIQIVAAFGGAAVGFFYAAANGGQISPAEIGQLQIMGGLIGIVLSLLYYILPEAIMGITIGKLITGTRVIREDGNDPTFGQLIGRTLARMIPFEPLSFLFGDKTVGWHDSLSGTRVVRKNK